jgi:hypothetical protein
MRRASSELRWVPLTVPDQVFVARRTLRWRPRMSGAVRLAEVAAR